MTEHENDAPNNDERVCWAALHAAEGMGPVTFRRLVERFGTARDVIAQRDAGVLMEARGVTSDLALSILRCGDRLDPMRAEIEMLRGRGVRLLRMGGADYPASLLELANPPPLLYVVGELNAPDGRTVSMVGTTKPSDNGRKIAEEFARRFAEAGVTVVSGFAHGIDAASHRGAFNGGGRSVLCVPYGLRHFKPRLDMPPLREIAQRGALVSECPPALEWSAQAAVARNRLIAALGRAVFVIETKPKGGTMHTVKAAEQLGRPVFALKYEHSPETARGNAIVLARGGIPIRTFGEIDRILGALASEGSQAPAPNA